MQSGKAVQPFRGVTTGPISGLFGPPRFVPAQLFTATVRSDPFLNDYSTGQYNWAYEITASSKGITMDDLIALLDRQDDPPTPRLIRLLEDYLDDVGAGHSDQQGH